MLGVLGEHVTQVEPGVLILEQDHAGINKLLHILIQHILHNRCINHVRQKVPVGKECVAYLLELLS